MLFKIDENVPLELSQLLSDLGHDSKTVIDEREIRVALTDPL